MKRTDIIIPVATMVFFYLLTAFVTWSFDLSKLDNDDRFFIAFMWTIVTAGSIGISRID